MPKYKFYLKAMHPVAGIGSDWIFNWFSDGWDNILSDGDTYSQEWHQFYPGVSRDIALEYDIWDHKHRRKLKGDLTFINNQIQLDYSILSKVVNESMEIKIRIEQTCSTTASDWWEGYFSIVDGKWDTDRGILTVSASPDDEYRLLEELGDHSYNLYELSPNKSARINFYGVQKDAWSSCTDLESGAGQSGWQEYHTPQGTDQFPYVVDPLEWADYTLYETIPCSGGNIYHYTAMGTIETDFGNSRGLLIKDAIQYLVNNIAGLEYVSTFFDNDEFQPGDIGIPIGTKNYVTETDPNPLNGMVMFQKSDVKLTSDRATMWKISFNEFMDILKTMFNVDWFIDNAGKFRIEHWSYFENTYGSDLDLTVLDGGKWAFHKNKFSYELNEMPNIEHFEWAEANNIDFIGKDIIYNSVATSNRYKDNIKSYSVPVSTDAVYIYDNPSDISNEGWVLLTVASDIIISEVGMLSGISLPNNHLSWANLHYNYWRHGRVLINGNMNGSDMIFLSSQRHIKQEEITYPECCGAFDPMAYKITGLGEGEVRAAEYRLLDGSVKTVFFYHSVSKSDFPEPETYFISTTGNDEFLFNGGKLIWYG